KKEHQYVFTNVNDALYSIKPKPVYVRKVTSLPEVLKIFPVSATGKEENVKFNPLNFHLNGVPADSFTDELTKLQDEFKILKSIVERSEEALAVLNEHWRTIPVCI